MNHRQRLEACISGNEVDRPPVALWRHFPVDDSNAVELSKSIVTFQNTYDFDFIKVTPSSSFCVSDYGVVDAWRGNPEGTRDYISYPISNPADWSRLSPLPLTRGELGKQLECLARVIEQRDPHTPVIQTVFNPLSQAKNLIGKENLIVHIRKYPNEVLTALDVLTDNTLRFVDACINLGVDGIFFAVQHAQSSLLADNEIRQFMLPFDERVVNAASSLWLNVLHLHGTNINFDLIPKDGFSVVNWHDLETQPSLPEGKKRISGAVCGGMRQWETLVYGTPEIVNKEARQAIQATQGKRFILGTGCVLPIIAPRSNIMAARLAVES